MAYIRDRREEKTGFQESRPWSAPIDVQSDFAMVYGVDPTMPERVKEYCKRGYVVHLMTGIAWGQYQEYLDGKFDGRKHWDESQEERDGKPILHGPTVPYMVPTIAFCDYLTARLKVAVDAGVEAIHVEEPEFWDRGGYSPAFQREYLLYFREEWRPPHESADARYRCAQLKAYLYARAISRVAGALKEYALITQNRRLRVYVPTHSLLNYTQWKILSPEGALLDLPEVDGYIAQVWTGTSRTANMYRGLYKERTFETAYLEYGVMQQLVRGTGRDMWFLNDPIEDMPNYTWDNYKANYLKTLAASLLHGGINKYEICPWPTRVFSGKYPRQPQDDGRSMPAPDAKPIPPDYAALLCSLFQMLGDMPLADHVDSPAVAVAMSDTGLFQRGWPDGIVSPDTQKAMAQAVRGYDVQAGDKSRSQAWAQGMMDDTESLRVFEESGAFPLFYGLAMPPVKHGLRVEPLLIDNVRRFPAYLNEHKVIVLSYEYLKPLSPDVNNALAAWVRAGGKLFYVGDGQDPYHHIRGWWNRETQGATPFDHLMTMLGLAADTRDGLHTVGQGQLLLWRERPSRLCLDGDLADEYMEKLGTLLGGLPPQAPFQVRRGPYMVCAVPDEAGAQGLEMKGSFINMFDPDFPAVTDVRVAPGQELVLFDLDCIDKHVPRVIGTCARVETMDMTDAGLTITCKAPSQVRARMLFRLPAAMGKATARDEKGNDIPVESRWDEAARTLWLAYESDNQLITLTAVPAERNRT